MSSHSDRRYSRDPQHRTIKPGTPAVDSPSHPAGRRPLPPRPMRDILGDEDDLPTFANAQVNPAARLHLSRPEPAQHKPAHPAAPQAPGKLASPDNSPARAPVQPSAPRANTGHAYAAQQRGIHSRNIEEPLFGPAFERPLLRPHPIPLSPRGPLMMLVVSLVSIMIILSASGGGEQNQLAEWFGGGGAAANSLIPAAGGGNLADARPPGNYELKAPPSIGPQQIDRILAEYGSPATGTGPIWYELGRRYGIDPAFAVAFFIHESGAGTSPAWAGLKPDGSTTHNVGNIICAGYPRCYGRFRDYGSWQEGIEDWYRLIDVEYLQGRGHRTVADIIPVYAPSIENDVQNYINVVHRLVDEWRSHGVR